MACHAGTILMCYGGECSLLSEKHTCCQPCVQDKFGWDRPILMLMLWSDGTHLDAARRHKVEVVMACWGKLTSRMLVQGNGSEEWLQYRQSSCGASTHQARQQTHRCTAAFDSSFRYCSDRVQVCLCICCLLKEALRCFAGESREANSLKERVRLAHQTGMLLVIEPLQLASHRST